MWGLFSAMLADLSKVLAYKSKAQFVNLKCGRGCLRGLLVTEFCKGA